MEHLSQKADVVRSTHKSALYLWVGLSLALTLFYVQSQIVFVKSEPLPSQSLEWVFSLLGMITFVFGVLFFNAYTRLRHSELLRMPFPERRQNLLVAFVFQFILFETLGLYGVLLSVLTQSGLKSIPFLAFAYLGFLLSFPRRKKVEAFFVAHQD